MTMTSTYLLVLTAVLSAAASSSSLLFVDAFSPIAVVHHTTPSSRLISAPLGMGIFDAFQKAFSNEAYGAPPEAIKATARHILVPSLEDANRVLSEIGKATGARYEDSLRDDDLPGKPGETVHSWLGLMRYNYQTMIKGLGGKSPALDKLTTTPANPDEAVYPQ